MRAGNAGGFGDASNEAAATPALLMDVAPPAPAGLRVRAVNAIGSSPATARASATWTGPPDAPINLIALPGHERVTLKWVPRSHHLYGGPPLLRHQYRMKETGGGTYGDWRTIPDSGETGKRNKHKASFTVTGLDNGTAYTFQVRAGNAGGFGDASNEAAATPAVLMDVAPPAPAGLTAEAGDAAVHLAWTTVGSGSRPIDRHRYRQRAGDAAFGNWRDIPDSAPGGANATSFTVSPLANATVYTFEVQAVSGDGQSLASNAATATPAAMAGRPGPPAGFRVVTGNRQAALSWDAPARRGGSAVTAYRVRHDGPDGGGAWRAWVETGPARAHTFELLHNTQGYVFEVQARNGEGWGAAKGRRCASAGRCPTAPRRARSRSSRTPSRSTARSSRVPGARRTLHTRGPSARWRRPKRRR